MSFLKTKLREWMVRQNETLDVDPIDVPLPDLPDALDGYRIAVIADLHIDTLRGYHGAILDAVRDARPECILVAGDTIDAQTGGIAEITPLFEQLSRLAPTVAVLGNNDCLRGRIDSLRAMYHNAGVTLLENETRLLSARGFPLRITGLLDPEAENREIVLERAAPAQAYVPVTDVLPPKEEEAVRLPSILLLHRPQLALHYLHFSPSLIVAGHAHGGQFRPPHTDGLYAPDQGVLPKYTSGLYKLDHSYLVVSRGLGNHKFPLRLNNPPHIPLIHLRKG